MADAKRCDRCRSFYELPSKSEAIPRVRFIYDDGRSDFRYDLCPSCLLQFGVYMSDPNVIQIVNDTCYENEDEAP